MTSRCDNVGYLVYPSRYPWYCRPTHGGSHSREVPGIRPFFPVTTSSVGDVVGVVVVPLSR